MFYRWLMSTAIMLLTAWILPGVSIDSVGTAIIASLIWGVVSFFAVPILFILTLPITVVTLGLFMFVLNALILLIVPHMVNGFVIDGFWSALWFSLIYSILMSIVTPKTQKK